MNEIQLWIDDQKVKAKAGLTILEAARELGITVPSLCYHPALKPSGSCRLCAVEIEGYRGLPAACTTPVTEGMRVRTATSKVNDFRREMLRMLLQEHPRDCLGCSRNGTCELQQLVSAVGIDFPYAPPTGKRPPAKPGGDYFERDYSLCVHCGRCVRMCHEVRGAKAIVFREVKGRQEVSTPFDRSLEEAGCQFCGACVDVCPTGALRERREAVQKEPPRQMLEVCENLTDIVMSLYVKEQPRRWTSSICPVCTAGCRMMFELNEANEIVQVRPSPQGPTNRGQGCVQGRFLLKRYMDPARRLTGPLAMEGGALVEKSWDAALDLMANRLKGFGPGEVAVLTDCRATNEELYLLQKFARSALNTNSIGCLTPRGHNETAKALREDIGVMAATNSLEDLTSADVILAIGLNPSASHPIAGTRLREAVLNGAKLVVANPCTIPIARYANVHLPYTPDTELPLILGFLRAVIDHKEIDPAFADQYAKELQELRGAVQAYDLDHVAKVTGMSEEILAEAACILAEGRNIAILYGPGLLGSPAAADTLKALVTLSHLKGALGRPGGGIAPLYGAANLQGAWDMGMVSDLLPGQVDWANEKERKRFANAWKTDLSLPAANDVFKDLASGKIKALYLVMDRLNGEDLEPIRPYLGKLDFVAVQDIVPPEKGLRADVVLPAASLLEKEGTLTNGERRVQWVQPVLPAPENARSVQWVLSELARRLGASGFAHDGFEAVLKEISGLVPGYGGITSERARVNPPQWPCKSARDQGSPILFVGGKPAWSKWKPELSALSDVKRDGEYPFAVVAAKNLEPFFTGSLVAPEAANAAKWVAEIVMNPADIFGMGLKNGDEVRVAHRFGGGVGRVGASYLVPPKTVVLPAALCQKPIVGLNLVIKVSFARVEKI